MAKEGEYVRDIVSYIISFLENKIVCAWIAPIFPAVVAGIIVQLLFGRKKEGTPGNVPQKRDSGKIFVSPRRYGRQTSLLSQIKTKCRKLHIGTVVVGLIIFFAAQAWFTSGNLFHSPRVVKLIKTNAGVAQTLVNKAQQYWIDEDGTKYMGVRKNGIIEGEGRAVYTNGEVYKGEFKAGLRHGTGILYSADGLILYDGDWKDNVQEGTGINYFCDGKERYEGDFKAGQREGDGVYYWENGDRYEGKWENDVRNGVGEFISADGTRTAQIWLEDEFVTNLILNAESWTDMDGTVYTGKKEKDKIEGYGRVVYDNGNIYVGQLREGNKDGNGIYYYQNGDRYEGEWRDGQLTGTGIYYFSSNGGWYQGDFLDGQLEGKGTYYDPSGSRYEGELKDGKYFGEGTCWYAPDDERGRWYFEGEWTEDSQIGTLYYKDGTCETGVFQNDELVEACDPGDEVVGIAEQPEVTTWKDGGGAQYTGRREDGLLVGEGICINGENTIYIGEFKDGIREGIGTQYFDDGDYYTGEFAEGRRNGTGVYYYSDGGEVTDWYYGEWVDGERTGNCIIGFFGKTFYTGDYVDNYYNGHGNRHYTDGVYYGEWQNGKRTGTGVFSASDGSCYFGEYRDDKKSGYGVKYYPDGSRYEGEWESNEKNGTGTLYYADGTKKYGTWADGEYQN